MRSQNLKSFAELYCRLHSGSSHASRDELAEAVCGECRGNVAE